ncbi:hypothetical protein P7K49_014163, partial [Saguinus oedipus]
MNPKNEIGMDVDRRCYIPAIPISTSVRVIFSSSSSFEKISSLCTGRGAVPVITGTGHALGKLTAVQRH